MKKVILTTLCSLALLTSCESEKTTYVYICTSPKAEVYHNDIDCKGLSRCSYDVDRIEQEKAAKFRRPCKICY